MHIDWTVDGWTAIAYAAWRIRQGSPAPNSPLMKVIGDHVKPLDEVISHSPVADVDHAWSRIPLLAAQGNSPDATAKAMAERLDASREREFAETLGRLREASYGAAPDLEARLAHRIRPLKDSFEAVGPGMLRQIRQVVGDGELPSRAIVTIVEPIQGGAEAFPRSNHILFEGLLANIHPTLPETTRLAWSLAQLAVGKSENRSNRLSVVHKLAMIPPTLAAAEALGIGACDHAAVSTAISAWLANWELPTPADTTCDSVDEWWRLHLASGGSWDQALFELDQRLASDSRRRESR